ncbi:hypothetical protein IGB42_01398 [Andreprevotia sp. IGB-42]|uniref:DUF1993 domain-containing protein n=1 Tax=Andreprevotia sp. IGB-42 TaxID=2497473 RepID=UPI001356CA2A|nr:DUF1993 domain-containing protein [Andreprevotia sp. IGB-42]KAF0814497.1 hypothetical protein IGB42_01398 [Andreprevotia sp. IGB-42]
MSSSLYLSSVPVFTRYLQQLAAMLALAQTHIRQTGMDEQALLATRLAADMHPFLSHVQIADDFARRACAPLAGVAKPEYAGNAASLAELAARIATTLAFLAALPAAAFDGNATRQISSAAGQQQLVLDAGTFLLHYALPNFFFHITIAYAILRHLGVEIGKRDFDGFHLYPSARNGDTA